MTCDGRWSFSANGLHFREWCSSDAHDMVTLFDTDEMDRWTPLPSPFTAEVAAEYVVRAKEMLEERGILQLAICSTVTGPPIGEVLLFPSAEPRTFELAYAVGAEHRGRQVGARAVKAVLELARLAKAERALLSIAEDNLPSQATAAAAGFARTDAPLRRRERKGFVLLMETWEKHLLT